MSEAFSPPVLHLYSRPHCQLCEELEDALYQYFSGQFRLQWHDVDRDPVTRESMGLRIPVLTDEAGNELSSGHLQLEVVRGFLKQTGVATRAV